ncbi:MAG: hypothetical protein IJN23_02670 [Akkermansia sp.]|nr:hypothetical protein [Akkermansia sp.]
MMAKSSSWSDLLHFALFLVNPASDTLAGFYVEKHPENGHSGGDGALRPTSCRGIFALSVVVFAGKL